MNNSRPNDHAKDKSKGGIFLNKDAAESRSSSVRDSAVNWATVRFEVKRISFSSFLPMWRKGRKGAKEGEKGMKK